MAGPTKKPRKPAEPHSDDESMSDESESGTYQGQQVIINCYYINFIFFGVFRIILFFFFRKLKQPLKAGIQKDPIFMALNNYYFSCS